MTCLILVRATTERAQRRAGAASTTLLSRLHSSESSSSTSAPHTETRHSTSSRCRIKLVMESTPPEYSNAAFPLGSNMADCAVRGPDRTNPVWAKWGFMRRTVSTMPSIRAPKAASTIGASTGTPRASATGITVPSAGRRATAGSTPDRSTSP